MDSIQKKLKILFSVLLFLSLLGCRGRSTAMVVDPYWYEMATSSYSLTTDLLLRGRGVRLVYLNDQLELDLKILDEGGALQYDRIIFSPLAYHWWTKTHGPIQIPSVVMGGSGLFSSGNSHVAFMKTDRLDSFSEAGKQAAEYVTAQSLDAFMVIHFYMKSERRSRELEAFIQGYNTVASSETLLVHRIQDLKDHNLDYFQTGIEGKKVVLYGLFASSLNEYLLNSYKLSESPLITENHSHSGVLGDRILFSVEKDYKALVRKAIELSTGNIEKNIETVPAVLVK